MDIERRLNTLEELIKKQQGQISGIDEQMDGIKQELVGIDDEMNRPGQGGYPSLFDVKQKLVELGWLKKP
jgi:hypothetical protein